VLTNVRPVLQLQARANLGVSERAGLGKQAHGNRDWWGDWCGDWWGLMWGDFPG
jgi:hypothetical protein